MYYLSCISALRIQQVVRAAKWPLIVFLTPFALRMVPEILAGPYPVGWDVIAYYIPNLLDWSAGRKNVWEMIGSPPLLYAIVLPIFEATRNNVVLLFKILGPTLFGALGYTIFRFCKNNLLWSDKKAAGAVLFITTCFPVLRISWDAFQIELGLIFFLTALSVRTLSESKRYAVRSGLLALSVLSSQLVGVVVVGYTLIGLLQTSKMNHLLEFLHELPSSILFILVFWATFVMSKGLGWTILGPVSLSSSIYGSVAFLVYANALVAPAIILGARLLRKSVLITWILVCTGGLVLSALPVPVLQDLGYRWVLIESIPLLLTAFQGYVRLDSMKMELRTKSFLRVVRGTGILSLVVCASLFVALPAELSFPYFTIFPNYIPSSMVQSSVPSSDYANVANAFSWLNSHLQQDSVLITHMAFYGWAKVYLSSDKQVLGSLLSSPSALVGEVNRFEHVLTIWWTKGAGWFAHDFPSGSVLIMSFGDIGIYQYR